MLDTDYHVHTSYSQDCNVPMEDMVNAAIAKELKEIALCDHIDYKRDGREYPYHIDYYEYMRKLDKIKESVSDQINLVLGVEVGIGSHLYEIVNQFIRNVPFQVVIGSIHDVLGCDLMTGGFFNGKKKKDAYDEYFHEMLLALKRTNIDILGHLDYIPRYAEYKDRSLFYNDHSSVLDNILIEIIYSGKGLEINTSGIRYHLGHLHPQLAILKRYKKLGGEIITVGSDSHATHELAHSFDLANEYLKVAGFGYISIFRDRKAFMVKI